MIARVLLFVLFAAVLLWCALPSHAGGVVVSADTRPSVEVIGEGGEAHGATIAGDLAEVPDDDGGKWQMLLFTADNCPHCVKLQEALDSNAALKALCGPNGWATLWTYKSGQRSQAFRLRDYQVTQFPTIVVTPPPTTKQWPYYQVFRRVGFDGDADGLARDIAAAVRDFARKHPPEKYKATPSADRNKLVPTPVDLLPNFPPAVPSVLTLIGPALAGLKTPLLWVAGALGLVWLVKRSQRAAPATSAAPAVSPPAASPAEPTPQPEGNTADRAVDLYRRSQQQLDELERQLQQQLDTLRTGRTEKPQAIGFRV